VWQQHSLSLTCRCCCCCCCCCCRAEKGVQPSLPVSKRRGRVQVGGCVGVCQRGGGLALGLGLSLSVRLGCHSRCPGPGLHHQHLHTRYACCPPPKAV
jgi:hypothetical protein